MIENDDEAFADNYAERDQAKQDAAAKPKVVQDAASVNADISRQLADLVQRSDEVSASQEQLNRSLAQLTERQRNLEIRPGMQATVELHTGQKTVLHYLLKPLYKSREALREP